MNTNDGAQAAHDRRLTLQGAPNFRDFGGYPAAGGGIVRRGALFRSGALGLLTQPDVGMLNSLGAWTIVDLRHEAERIAAPTPAQLVSSAVHSLPMGSGNGAAPVPRPALLTVPGATAGQAVEAIKASYRRFVHDHRNRFTSLFGVLLDGAPGPAVIHCTAGKDRTGISVALVLLALGVDRDAVVGDYCATRNYLDLSWREQILAAMVGDPGEVNRGVADVMFDAHPDYIGASLDEMDQHHGSPEAYLRDVIGLDAGRIETLRRRYLA
ncbi:tyrosine-protein phosphatase [Emcibacter sp. SYSU 3D8]|uniref:tyrosine-protein phosphatase n=1 Tax=Emcibacter sp. SYSU 3D8 TaxID=3133969 RepID=UPI0031FE5B3B